MRTFKQPQKRIPDQENSTTIGGTSVITPYIQSRKDSGFEAYAGSMISTPKLFSKSKRVNHDKANFTNQQDTGTSQITIFKSMVSGVAEHGLEGNIIHQLSKDTLSKD